MKVKEALSGKRKYAFFFCKPDISSEEGRIATRHSRAKQVSSDGELRKENGLKIPNCWPVQCWYRPFTNILMML